jgi:hypothetical protein
MYGASVLTARMVECPLECRRSARRGIQTVRAADVMSSIQEWASTTAQLQCPRSSTRFDLNPRILGSDRAKWDGCSGRGVLFRAFTRP